MASAAALWNGLLCGSLSGFVARIGDPDSPNLPSMGSRGKLGDMASISNERRIDMDYLMDPLPDGPDGDEDKGDDGGSEG